MEPTESLLVAAFDAESLSYVVLGNPGMSFPGAVEARRAGCIVMPQAPKTGDVWGLSSTERTVWGVAVGRVQPGPRLRVISKVAGTLWRPSPSRPALPEQPINPAPEPGAPQTRRRR